MLKFYTASIGILVCRFGVGLGVNLGARVSNRDSCS